MAPFTSNVQRSDSILLKYHLNINILTASTHPSTRPYASYIRSLNLEPILSKTLIQTIEQTLLTASFQYLNQHSRMNE